MLSYDPSKRISIDELQTHPWITTTFNEKEAKRTIMEKMYDKNSLQTAYLST